MEEEVSSVFAPHNSPKESTLAKEVKHLERKKVVVVVENKQDQDEMLPQKDSNSPNEMSEF